MPFEKIAGRCFATLATLTMFFFFACESDDGTLDDRTPPTVPGGLKALEVEDTSILVSWEVSGDNVATTGYVVYQNDLQVSNDSVTRYRATGLDPETKYSYKVRAVDAAGNVSGFTPELLATTLKKTQAPDIPVSEPIDTIAPTEPQNLSVTDIERTTANLGWEASTDNLGVVAYRVFQDATLLATVPDTQFSLTNLLPETEYSFFVSAIDKADNESDLSEVLTFSMLTEVDSIVADTVPPTRPLDLVAVDSTETTIGLSWSAATDSVGVIGYRVFQDTVLLATITGTQYQAVDLNAGTSYNFAVTALDGAENESEASETLTVSTATPEEVEPPATVDKILVFTKTVEFRHTSIPKGVATLIALGAANDFEVEQTENATDFTLENLQQYQAVVFLSTTGDVLNKAQQDDFESYIRSGGGFMGIHAATDTEYNWAWYGQLVGAYFNGHPSIQEANVDVTDAGHPSTSALPDPWTRTDEWYNFKDINPNINVLLNLDESTYNGGTNGTDHPIAWFHEFEGGRSFYTGGGHSDSSFDEPYFQAHLLGGVLYCLGR
ncbi:MAG: ThuA domain-containing protein [Pricia sp.]